ncbi:hypothetical protein CR513_38192, partial [Mucuna pruriens]
MHQVSLAIILVLAPQGEARRALYSIRGRCIYWKGNINNEHKENRWRAEVKGRGVGGRALVTINSPTLPFTSQPQQEPQPTFVGELILTIPFVVVTPSTLEDSLTPEYLSLYSEHLVNQRHFLQVIDKE